MPLTTYDRTTATATQYPRTIDPILNGDPGNATTYMKPAVDLDKRTEALRLNSDSIEANVTALTATINTEKTELDTLQSTYGTHAGDSSVHYVLASASEVNSGTVTTNAVSPKTATDMVKARIGLTYDAIVGPASSIGTTHTTLAAALAEIQSASPYVSGKKILVTNSQILTATLSITQPNIEIEFRRGATISTSTSVTPAFRVSNVGHDFYLEKARLEGFTVAVEIVSGAMRTTLRDLRFKSCGSPAVSDSGTNTSNSGSITE